MIKYISIDNNGRYFVSEYDSRKEKPRKVVLSPVKHLNARRYLKPGGRLSVELKLDNESDIECVFCKDNFVIHRIPYPFNWQNICDWLNHEG